MTNIRVISGAIVALLVSAATAATVTFSLSSSQNGQTVSPGTSIDWEISVVVSNGDNAGLALVSADLVQDGGNAEAVVLPKASTIPASMSNFDVPAGIANPGEDGDATGYIGSVRNGNLIQIGGAQNNFGTPGATIGTNATPVAGVGQSGAQVVASGSFPAPSTDGSYTFSLQNVLANVFTSIGAPGQFSPVEAATADAASANFSFTVGASAFQPGDLNCDGLINTSDIDPFVLALLDPAGYDAAFPACDRNLADVNQDGSVNTSDIDPFVSVLLGS